MADIFEEVEEGLRQDKLSTLWGRYGFFAYLAGALLIGGVALNEYLTYTGAAKTEARSGELQVALDELDANDYVAATESFTDIVALDAPIAPVASHFLAQLKIEGNGDIPAAAQLLSDAGGAGEGALADLATLKAAYLTADETSFDLLKEKLRPISESGSAFGAMARELLAAKALAEGDIEYARSEYNLLRVSSNVPDGVQIRVSKALAILPPPPSPAEQSTETNVSAEEAVDSVE